MPRVKKITSAALPSSFAELVKLRVPSVIRDEVDYDNARELIDALTSAGTLADGQRQYLETMTILFADYEAKVHAIDTSDLSPTDMLKHFMEEHGMNASDIGRLLGERSLGPKILNGDRELSKSHIRTLAEHFGVSPAVFL